MLHYHSLPSLSISVMSPFPAQYADRLDLGRVGMMPEPTKLCTAAAKAPKMLKWADGRAAFEVVPELVKSEWGIDLRD